MEKSLSSAQITASLSLLREPRSRPAGFPVKLTAHQRQEAIQRMERQGLHQWSTRPDSMQQIHRRAQYFIILRIGRNWGLAFLIILIRSRL